MHGFFYFKFIRKGKINMYDYNNSKVRPQFASGNNVIPIGLPKGAVPQNATGGAVPTWSLGQQKSSILLWSLILRLSKLFY
jgi:hypothetical protein